MIILLKIHIILYSHRYGYNLLLTACIRKANDDTLSIIRFLLEVANADPNKLLQDDVADSPLHLVVDKMKEGELDSPAAALLLQHGAHLDAVNKIGQTPLDVWKENQDSSEIILSPPDWLNPVHRLHC